MMKKTIAALLTVVLLSSLLSFSAFATTDVVFSMKGAEGVPGDTVTVEVHIDKNIGTWSSKFIVEFNERYFTLLDVKNGDVFPESGFIKGSLTNKGKYEYYADGDDPLKNVEATGLVLTLEFEISKACPNGDHEIKITFPNDGAGWFFDATQNDLPDRTVSCNSFATVSVSGSSATASPEEDTTAAPPADSNEGDAGNDSETTPPKKPSDIPVTEAVTDEAGETVVDTDGNVVTEIVRDEEGNEIYYETDESGNIETDNSGNYVTEAYDTNNAPETNDNGETLEAPQDPEDSENANNSDDDKEDNGAVKKVILIAAIAAVVIGAVIVIIVLAKNSKKSDNEDEE